MRSETRPGPWIDPALAATMAVAVGCGGALALAGGAADRLPWLLIGGLAAGVGVLPGELPLSGTSLHRAALALGQPNGLGLFLALPPPLVLHRRDSARGAARTGWVAVLLLASGGLVGTFSRGAVLAVLENRVGLRDDPEARTRLGAAGRDRELAPDTQERVTRETVAFYRELLEEAP